MKIRTYFFWLASVSLSFYVLLVGKDLLVPLVIAVILWYLTNALTTAFARVRIGGRQVVRPVCFTLSVIVILSVLFGLITLITDNITEVIKAAPEYQHNLERIIGKVFGLLRLKEPPTLSQLLRQLDLTTGLRHMAVAVGGVAGNVGIILIYLLFLFLEQKSFNRKLMSLVADETRQQEMMGILRHIDSDVRMYVGIKVLTSAITGITSYVVMRIVGLDFAEFWAILIFIFNFIPTIGSIIATIFPALLAIVQFESLVPFVVVAGGIGGLQFAIGNVLEPRLMGNRLNLSPLVILLSLAVWGTLWGITGMILSVPITAICMIVLSHFPQSRPIAVLLSRRGRIQDAEALRNDDN